MKPHSALGDFCLSFNLSSSSSFLKNKSHEIKAITLLGFARNRVLPGWEVVIGGGGGEVSDILNLPESLIKGNFEACSKLIMLKNIDGALPGGVSHNPGMLESGRIVYPKK